MVNIVWRLRFVDTVFVFFVFNEVCIKMIAFGTAFSTLASKGGGADMLG